MLGYLGDRLLARTPSAERADPNFQAVQQPVCIALAARKLGKDTGKPARVRFQALPTGSREEKFAALGELSLGSSTWIDCPTDWRDPFLPVATGAWATYPSLKDFFVYDGSGVMPGRTWIIAPDAESLRGRWKRLIDEKNLDRKEVLFHPHLRNGKPGDKHLRKSVHQGLTGHEERLYAVIEDKKLVIEPVRYGFRSFDRQWIIPDARLINQPNPTLWKAHSPRQIYLTALEAHSPVSGPTATFTGLIPDLHHYKGSFGGRVYPLWRDRAATDPEPNIKPALLSYVGTKIYGQTVKAEDILGYLAAVMAHPAFTARFKSDLVRPGLRVPLTADAKLFAEAVALGREVVWLHTCGERFADPAAGRPKQSPRLPKENAPSIPKAGAIPGASEPLPEAIDYDPATRRLKIGKGYVENVTPEMWAYEVSRKQVLGQWFSYRRRDRTKPPMGDKRPPSPLEQIVPESWLPEYTSDLIDLLHVLGRLIALEPKQADLLNRICDSRLLSADELRSAGALAHDEQTAAKQKGKSKKQGASAGG